MPYDNPCIDEYDDGRKYVHPPGLLRPGIRETPAEAVPACFPGGRPADAGPGTAGSRPDHRP